ncbi:MAG TPA: Asp-tRNA(Asn)/Glu-tRNA(Gln) amidotransferase subunit GatC, partial [Helicobacter sp.]|nr:Asp-tRNA(Asn)/Glu-tRNA(Gln) amidotransferase subunit GatC [Helicobacter sp.]
MQIDDALLSKLERLSMIRIDDKKRTQTQEQLTEIVGFVENLSA